MRVEPRKHERVLFTAGVAGLDVSMFTSMPGLAPGGIGFGGTLRYSDGNVRLAGLLVRLVGLLGNGPSDRPAGGWNVSFGVRLRY